MLDAEGWLATPPRFIPRGAGAWGRAPRVTPSTRQLGMRTSPGRSSGSFLWRATALLLLGTTSACYVYGPAATDARQGTQVQAFLNDQGRAVLAASVGARTRAVSGDVVAASDSTLQLAVTETLAIDGTVYQWNGERVGIQRALLDSVRARRVSVARSAAVAGGVVLAALLVRAAFGLGANGGAGTSPPPQPK